MQTMSSLWNIQMLTSSYWGMYAVQTVLHSFIASVFSYCALLAWDVKAPHVRQRFHFMVIFLPVVAFPLYQVLAPSRGDIFFRLQSILDSNNWFLLDLMGGFPVILVIFLGVLVLTTVIFIVQELVPIVLHLIRPVHDSGEESTVEIDDYVTTKASEAISDLPFDENSLKILRDNDLFLFSSTGLRPVIYVSAGLVRSFSSDHLRAAFAHEIGHIRRSRKPVLLFAYILRVLMFYNPIAMIEFRKLAQEEEKVCDDIAISLTGRPEALAEAIEMLREGTDHQENEPFTPKGADGMVTAIEHYSHDALLQSRGFRIRHHLQGETEWGVPYFVTLTLVVALNYFIV